MKKFFVNKFGFPLILLGLLSFFIQCGGEKTEQEKYNDLTSGIKYNAYKKLSQVSVPAAIGINNMQNDTNKIEIAAARLLLGYFWTVSGKPNFALAESNIIMEDEKDSIYRLLNFMMRSICLYEAGLKQMSVAESQKAYALLNKNPDDKESQYSVALYHLLIGSACINEKNYKAAAFHFYGFGLATGIMWPAIIVDAMADIENGNIQTGLVKLKKLSKDESLPIELRQTLAASIEEVEKTTGPVESKLFWGRAIGNILFSQLKESSNKSIANFSQMVEGVSKKLL